MKGIGWKPWEYKGWGIYILLVIELDCHLLQSLIFLYFHFKLLVARVIHVRLVSVSVLIWRRSAPSIRNVVNKTSIPSPTNHSTSVTVALCLSTTVIIPTSEIKHSFNELIKESSDSQISTSTKKAAILSFVQNFIHKCFWDQLKYTALEIQISLHTGMVRVRAG